MLLWCRYRNTKTAVRNRYLSIRNAKLTRWQKVKYGACAAVVLFILAVVLLTMLDIYLQDTESAYRRLDNIWWCTCVMAQGVWDVSVMGGTYVCQGTQWAAEHIWYCLRVASHYGLVGAQVAGHHIYEGGVIAIEYGAAGTKIAANHAYETALTCGHYAWVGTKSGTKMAYEFSQVVMQYAGHAAVVTWHCLKDASIVGSQYAVNGCKIGASYTASGLDYTVKHGTVAVKEGSVWLYHNSVYFVTNFREASAEAAVWSWATAKCVAEAMSSASYTSGVWLAHVSYDGFVKLCDVSVASFYWLSDASTVAAQWSAVAAISAAQAIRDGSICSFNFAVTTTVSAYEATVLFFVNFYNGAVSFHSWVTSTAQLVWDWTTAFAAAAYRFMYVAVTEYGFNWAVAIFNALVKVGCLLGRVLGKFFGDLGMYVANFFYVTSSRLASVVYVVLMFVYHIVAGVGTVIKALIGVAVYCTTRVFSVVIWFLRETLFAYLYMLHKYNMYRELLFLAFVGLLSVYCTGLMRDRRRLNETDEPDGSTDDDESGEDEAEDLPDVKSKQVVSVKDLSLTTESGEMPSFDEVDAHDETLTEFAIPEQCAADEEDHELREEDLVPDSTVDDGDEDS